MAKKCEVKRQEGTKWQEAKRNEMAKRNKVKRQKGMKWRNKMK